MIAPLGGRRILTPALGRSWQRGGAVSWWLSGGIPAANCIAAYQPKGAADYATSKSNLANPGTYDATEGTAPDWDITNGWKFISDDTSEGDHLDTGVSINGGGYSVVVRFSNQNTYNAARLVGTASGANSNPRLFMLPLNSSVRAWIHGSSYKSVSGALTEGVMAICGSKAYVDGVDEGVDLGSWTGTNTDSLYIGAQHGSGIDEIYPIDAYIQAVAIYNIDISAYISALTTAMNAL